jgi:hypothetical protein
VKVGDLITFKPIGFGKEDWSNPCIVLREWEGSATNPEDNLWIVWCDGIEAVVDNKNYEVMYLTTS